MAVTLKDLAKELNVSAMTVSRVLNGRADGLISENTKQRVMATAARMGYRPNPIARALVTGRTDTIGLLVGEIGALELEFLHPLQRLLAADGYDVLILNHTHRKRFAGKTSTSPLSVDGVFCLDLPPVYDLSQSGQALGLLSAQGTPVPVVCLGSYYDPGVDYVGVDIWSAMVDAVHHLADAGRRTLALIVPTGEDAVTGRYRDSFAAGAEQAGVCAAFIDSCSGSADQRVEGREAITRYLADNACPDGMVVVADTVAIGVCRGLRDLGLRVPEDVALVGCDGIPDVEYLDPPLSTMQTPFEAMCRLGWQYLRTRIDYPNTPPQQTVVSAKLVVRRSSAGRGGTPMVLSV
jgi:DNA-binding LacI/PurR family transcriptional regulator